jgi:hypothetical protein
MDASMRKFAKMISIYIILHYFTIKKMIVSSKQNKKRINNQNSFEK